jgi:hypothetical protein
MFQFFLVTAIFFPLSVAPGMTLMLSSAFKAVALLAVMLITIDGTSVTLRHREMSTVGRQEWIEHNIVTEWEPHQTVSDAPRPLFLSYN